MVQIPAELVGFAKERRIIPFVGAGFSAGMNLPNWDSLLEQICSRTEGTVSYDELRRSTNGDFLQMAEYLYLKSDKNIGPIRHHLERSLASHGSSLTSSAHVELVNLAAPVIYTTNYDDLIEETFRTLDQEVNTVVLPKDVALAANSLKTQVVKYHGDLQHEDTLVLTESAYFRRLDFESPMDLKFRGDILGKSVLFMGYSFRDVNIRLIWFKLMQMMKDIPAADRVKSYIVRLCSNSALEALDRGVGLETIVLCPGDDVVDAEKGARHLSEFLLQLSLRAQEPDLDRPKFVSGVLIDHLFEDLERMGMSGQLLGRYGVSRISRIRPAWDRFETAVVPEVLRSRSETLRLSTLNLMARDAVTYAEVVRQVPASAELTREVFRLLSANQSEHARKIREDLVREVDIWPKIWQCKLSIEEGRHLVAQLYDELPYQAQRASDSDIVFMAELCKRMTDGLLLERTSQAMKKLANELLREIGRMYPAAKNLRPSRKSPPEIDGLMADVEARANDWHPIALELPPAPDFLKEGDRKRSEPEDYLFFRSERGVTVRATSARVTDPPRPGSVV